MPISVATFTAVSRFGDAPLVLSSISRSPRCPRFRICSANTWSNDTSLDQAVINPTLPVNAMALIRSLRVVAVPMVVLQRLFLGSIPTVVYMLSVRLAFLYQHLSMVNQPFIPICLLLTYRVWLSPSWMSTFGTQPINAGQTQDIGCNVHSVSYTHLTLPTSDLV